MVLKSLSAANRSVCIAYEREERSFLTMKNAATINAITSSVSTICSFRLLGVKNALFTDYILLDLHAIEHKLRKSIQ